MRVLILSPYHGGSHQVWAEGYRHYSGHDVELLTLPARFWKWRMHGGAVTLARRFVEGRRRETLAQPDVLLATDMLDLTTFLALARESAARLPVALYMHENQLTYPLPQDPRKGPMRRQHGERDLHYVFINYASMLAAGRIFFNSHYHLSSLFENLPRFLKRFPEYNETGSINSLREKSQVLPVGLDLASLAQAIPQSPEATHAPFASTAPLVLWNQRWEYDKNPAPFFNALYRIQEDGVSFQLALCGERFGKAPREFAEARERLHEQIVHAGYADRETYTRLLWSSDVVVSTAIHEFFGISILEAIYCRTFPILPARLSYPELLPTSYHDACLYEDEETLQVRLAWALRNVGETRRLATRLASELERFSWSNMAPQYDAALQELARK